MKKRTGRIDPLVHLLAMSMAIVVAILALTVLAGPADDDRRESGLADELVARINAFRTESTTEPLADNPVLNEHAWAAAAAIAGALVDDPNTSLQDLAPDPDRLQAELPNSAEIRQIILVAPNRTELEKGVAGWEDARESKMTHVALAVQTVRRKDDLLALVSVGLVARLLPSIDPDLINRGQRDFHVHCQACGRDNLTRLSIPRGEAVSTASITCPNCKRLIDTFGVDRDGLYHRPSWFLSAFSPRKTNNVGYAWLYVLQNCRYVDDSKRYGRDEVWQTSRKTFSDRTGDCEDMSILLCDWLATNGYYARVVLGKHGGNGHAWVVVSDGGYDYILETTGGPRAYRRVPPRASVLPRYHPDIQFHRKGIWYRSESNWTSDYSDGKKWLEGRS